MLASMHIASRFCGPPDSGNGGYSAGLLAKSLGGVVEVTLRRPPPLDRELSVSFGHGVAELRDGEALVAEARPASLDGAPPQAPSFARALELSRGYVGHTRHHFPTCFVCGPARSAGDGLRIFPASEAPGGAVAAPWEPDATLCAADGAVQPEFVWAALDCPGYFAVAAPDYPVALLGRMKAEVTGSIRANEPCVIFAWPLGREGRKLRAGTAVFGADGKCRARAEQTWILLSA